MQERVNFQQLFVQTGEQHREEVEKEEQKAEDDKMLTESAEEMQRFREEAVPVIKGMPSVEDIRAATAIHPADNLEEKLTAIGHSVSASITLELSDTALAIIQKLRTECESQRKQTATMSKGIHLSYLSALCIGSSMLIVLIVAVVMISYNEYILHDARLTRLYTAFGVYLIFQNLVCLFVAKRWGGE